ncbi:MAG: transcriptional coactivator PipX [Microcoleaceae cyanobacterium]
MTTETYMNHPNFGLLFKVCSVEEHQELFTTLYAHRLFFLVTHGPNGLKFEPVSRSDAKLAVEIRLRTLRRMSQLEEYKKLQLTHQQTFQ